MNLNCKVGDLAIVVSARLERNTGQIVEILGPHSGKPFALPGLGHIWLVRAVSGRRSLHYCRQSTGKVFSRRTIGPVPDRRLRPLRPLDDDVNAWVSEDAMEDADADADARIGDGQMPARGLSCAYECVDKPRGVRLTAAVEAMRDHPSDLVFTAPWPGIC